MSGIVTVLTACYNGSQYLPDLIEALQRQTRQDWELIIVDDASSQGELASEVAARCQDARVRVIRHAENRGAGAAFNTAFAASVTPYIMIHGGDDVLAPTYLEKTLAVLEARPEVDAVFADIQLYGARNEVWRYKLEPTETLVERQWVPHVMVMRRQLWERTAGHYEGPELRHGNVDWDFFFSLVESGPVHWEHIAEPLYLYRQHQKNMSSKRSYNEFVTRQCMYQRHKAYIDAHGNGQQFVGAGYSEAAVASWKRDERVRAAQMAAKAYSLAPTALPELPEVDLPVAEVVRQVARLRVVIDKSGSEGLRLTQESLNQRLGLMALYARLGEFAEARHHLEVLLGIFMAAKAGENMPDLLVYLALLCLRDEDRQGAQEALDLALTLAPECAGAGLWQARLALDAGRARQALHVARRCVEASANKSAQALVQAMPVLGMVAAALEDSFTWEKMQESLEASLPAERTAKPLLDELVYASPLGRKLFWAYRAKDLYDTYGNTEGGFDALMQAVEQVRPQRILEIGCGNGRNLVLFSRLGIESVGQDISATALELARARALPQVTLLEKHLDEMDYADGYFDLVVSNRVLQHVTGEEARGMLRVMARIGKVIYLNELQPSESVSENYYYLKHDYAAILKEFGMKCASNITGEGVHALLFQRADG